MKVLIEQHIKLNLNKKYVRLIHFKFLKFFAVRLADHIRIYSGVGIIPRKRPVDIN